MALTTGTLTDGTTALERQLARGVTNDTNSDNQVRVGLSGDYEGFQFKFQGKFDRDTTVWYDLAAIDEATGAAVTGTLTPSDGATKSWLVPVAGLTDFRIQPSNQDDGDALVEILSGRFMDDGVLLNTLATAAVTEIALTNLAFTGLKTLGADGRNGAGAITLTGADVGERLIAVWGQVKANSGAHSFIIPVIGTDFEAAITVEDQIQQASASNLTANTYLFVLAPALS